MTLVLIPGLGSDAAVWSRTIAELHDVRCTIGDTIQDRSLQDMARRILADAPATFVLAGLSMGGMVALEVMRAEPRRVLGLAIVDSNAFPDTPEQGEQRRRLIAAVQAGLDLRVAGQASLVRLVHANAPIDVRNEIVDMGIRIGAETYARQIEAVLNRPDQRPVLATIVVPTLVIAGSDDAMVPVSCARAIAASIRGAELNVIPDCGHLPPIEKPRAVAGLLRELLARASACGSDQASAL